MFQPVSLWEVRPRGDGWTVVHTVSSLTVGTCLSHEEALYVQNSLRERLPDLVDVRQATLHHYKILKTSLEEAMTLRPEREMEQYTCVVTMRIPVWAPTREQAHTLMQEMLSNDTLFSYTDEFEPQVTVEDVPHGEYNAPTYVVTPYGLEEVERVPYTPVPVRIQVPRVSPSPSPSPSRK